MPIVYGGTNIESIVYSGVNLDKVVYSGVTVWEKWKHNPLGTLHNKVDVPATSGGYCECFIDFDKPTKVTKISGYSDFAGDSNFDSTMEIYIWAYDGSFSKQKIRSWSQRTRTSWSWTLPTEYQNKELRSIMYAWTLSNIAHSVELWIDDYYQKG